MCVYNNELIICGSFTQIDGISINHIAKWIGGNFTDSCSSPVNVEENYNSNKIKIYPNPSSNYLKISSENILFDKINITDVVGNIIYTFSYKNSSQKIDVSFLRSGLYFLTIETKDGNIVKKFVKE